MSAIAINWKVSAQQSKVKNVTTAREIDTRTSCHVSSIISSDFLSQFRSYILQKFLLLSVFMCSRIATTEGTAVQNKHDTGPAMHAINILNFLNKALGDVI